MNKINYLVKRIAKIYLNAISSNREPKIEQKSDRHGNKYWRAYDRHTNQSYTFTSEHDVRVWLENCYRYTN